MSDYFNKSSLEILKEKASYHSMRIKSFEESLEKERELFAEVNSDIQKLLAANNDGNSTSNLDPITYSDQWSMPNKVLYVLEHTSFKTARQIHDFLLPLDSVLRSKKSNMAMQAVSGALLSLVKKKKVQRIEGRTSEYEYHLINDNINEQLSIQ
ncbi:MAG: hypothetical protein K1X63_07590 [Chitinophagales bacterium]|nr:hypothetical protein [Chitinophagales bacterium]